MTKKKTFECANCGDTVEGEPMGSTKDDEPVCECCVENEEPDATVYYNDDDEPSHVMTFVEEDTNFQCRWVNTDGWRGYMDVTSEKYMKVHDDAILSGSADSEFLEEFDEMLRKFCVEQGIRFARVFTQTSNVFCQGYDFFVLREDMDDFLKLAKTMATVSKLTGAYRDSDRFTMTALTGKDEFDENDQKLLRAKKLLDEGKSFEEVMEEVLGDG